MKITNEKHLAILGQNYIAKDAMGGPKSYKKGSRVPTQGLYENNGYYVVEGHGIGHVIPRNLFNKFIKTWDEVDTLTENNKTFTKITHHKVDETDEILKWWAERDAKKNAVQNQEERGHLRRQIADLRKSIKAVKSGAAEKELQELLEKLNKK